jgi:serine/threonine-protein kinase
LTKTLTLQAPLHEFASGATVAGRYQIMEELGRGGMGQVYKAFDTEIKEVVALKILNPAIAGDETVIERFRNELKLARRIAHRSVCRMFDLGRAGDTTYITMEFVSGEDIKTLLRRVGQIPARRTVAIAKEVAEGLREAHHLGVVHRDLKPQNIMIDRAGSAHIMDFGIARTIQGSGFTDTGIIIGTPDYMSPEQLEGKDADQRSDFYAFGAVLFEMVTGEPPFEGTTPLVVAARQKTEKPRDPRSLNPQIPEALGRLILRCLEKDREKRYQSADEIVSELADIERELPRTRGLTAGATKTMLIRNKKPVWVTVLVILALGAAAAGYFFILRPRGLPVSELEKPSTPVGYKSSIAVLPFEDLSPQKDQEAFSSGLTDDLITKLSSLGQLKVISRQSVMRYKAADKDIREIGKELGVENILEGSIQREKDNIRVNVKLTRVRDGSNLWGETYDRKAESIFTVQDEISKSVINALRIELVAGQEYMLIKRYTQNPDAYNLYLEGRLEWNTRTERGIRRSIELFQKAIAQDPGFALAYAGIADAYLLLARLDFIPGQEAYPKAREAAEEALKIDDALAEGYVALAFVKYNYDWDWMGAEIDFNWAIGLNPNYATAYQYYGSMLESLGRFGEALAKFRKARELDPGSLPFRLSLAYYYFFTRQPDLMIRQAQEVLKLDQTSPWGHFYLGLAYQLKGSFKKALSELEKAEKISGGRGTYLADIASTQALAGNRENALKTQQELINKSGQMYVPAFSLALIKVALDDHDGAFEYLGKAFADKETGMLTLKIDPRLDPLRDDQRFRALLEKMNLR